MSRGLPNGKIAERRIPINVLWAFSQLALTSGRSSFSPNLNPLNTECTQCAARHLPECSSMLLQDLAMENARLVRLRKQGSAAEHEAGTSIANGKGQNGFCPGDSSSAV